MVRHRKKENELRVRPITIRATEAERSAIDNNAALAGLSRSAYVRRVAMDGEINVVQHRALDPESLLALTKLGNLLNQVVKHMHIHGEIDPDVRALCRKLDRIIAEAVME